MARWSVPMSAALFHVGSGNCICTEPILSSHVEYCSRHITCGSIHLSACAACLPSGEGRHAHGSMLTHRQLLGRSIPAWHSSNIAPPPRRCPTFDPGPGRESTCTLHPVACWQGRTSTYFRLFRSIASHVRVNWPMALLYSKLRRKAALPQPPGRFGNCRCWCTCSLVRWIVGDE